MVRFPAVLAGLYALLLTYILLAPHPLWIFGESGKQTEATIDRNLAGPVQHGMAYALFFGLVHWWWRSGRRRGVAVPVGLVTLHGVAAELAQNWIPFRQADWLDMAANLAGVLLGLPLALAVWTGRDRQGSQAGRNPEKRGAENSEKTDFDP